jgi:hypothetical protein
MTFNNYLILIAISLIINTYNPLITAIMYKDVVFPIFGALVNFDIQRKYCTFDFK